MTFPTPPTPPAPPAKPKVVLEGGGSVTDMPRPKSFGPTSDKDINEQKAKDHVAHGGGPLSKTTTTQADDTSAESKTNIDKNQAKHNQESQNQANRNQTNQNSAANTERPQIRSNQNQAENGGRRIDVAREFSEESTTNEQIASTMQPFQVRDSGHGVIYWGFTIISVGLLLAYLAKNYLFKKSAETGFSKRDLSYLTEAEEEKKPIETPVPPQKPTTKPQKSKPKKAVKQEPPKEGGHFEVRI